MKEVLDAFLWFLAIVAFFMVVIVIVVAKL